ncbi:hypothetical protein PLCT2_00425 [Planctomycetaceae bacterium]|nr:hypothetical protein PLCT2_00425 [Planctomycetaceae bacterium]
MQKAASVLCLLILVAIAVSERQPLTAQQDEKARQGFQLRPFNEHLEGDDAAELVGKALKGDKDAKVEIEKGGLAYVPLILNNMRSSAARHWGFSLLDTYRDWVEVMQGWEVALMRNDTAKVWELYGNLKPRFQHPQAQLARAIIHAWRLGDMPAARRLIALEPKHSLILCARAYAGIDMEPRDAATTMLAATETLRTLGGSTLYIHPAYHDEELRDYDVNTEQVLVAFQRAMFGPDRQEYLRALPREWELGAFPERMAALAAETGDSEFIKQIDAQFALTCGKGYESDARYITFHVACGLGLPKRANTPIALENAAARSTGPVLAAWAKSRASSGFELEGAVASVIGLYGNMDLNDARVFCLKQCLDYPDDLAGHLALRAVLALRDDCYDGIHNVAQALSSNAQWKLKAEAFAQVLEATKHPRLIELAKLMPKGALEIRPPAGSAAVLGLSVDQRALLLKPFVSADEYSGHGGLVGVYWLNRAQFAEAAGAHVAACDYFSAAVCSAAQASGRKQGNVNSVMWIDFVGRRYGAGFQGVLYERFKERFPGLKEVIEAESKLAADEGAKIEDRAFYVARDQVLAGKPVPAAAIKVLESDLRLGGGMGLLFGAFNGLNTRKSADWHKFMSRAPQASPLDMDVLFANGPTAERFGFNSKGQFESSAHAALRLSLVQPDWVSTLMRVGDVLAVQGSPCVAHAALYRYAARRTVARFVRTTGIAHPHYLLCTCDDARDWFRAVVCAWGDEIKPEDKRTAMDLMRALYWHTGASDNLMYISHTALRPEFVRRSLDMMSMYYDAQDVNSLLNFTLTTGRHDPERSLQLIQRAEDIGVNRYGRFVGSQMYIRSKAQLGRFEEAMARYKEMRGADVGAPAYLDRYLLLGLAEGNQHQQLDEAFKVMKEYEPDDTERQYLYAMRRALMAAGKYAEVAKVPAINSDARLMTLARAGEYSKAFHEARGHLDKGDYILLDEAVDPFVRQQGLGMIGEVVDACLLQALSNKELGGGLALPDKEGRLHCLKPEYLNYWVDVGPLLDYQLLEILVGKRDWKDLDAVDVRHYWHGAKYPERPSIHNGSGFLSAEQAHARDFFIRGVLAYLCGDKEKARERLLSCVDKDQRFSHEYHVAQWLLEKRLAPPAEAK